MKNCRYHVILSAQLQQTHQFGFHWRKVFFLRCKSSNFNVPKRFVVSLTKPKLWGLFYKISWSISTVEKKHWKGHHGRFSGRTHCLIDWPIVANLHRSLLPKKLASDNFSEFWTISTLFCINVECYFFSIEFNQLSLGLYMGI